MIRRVDWSDAAIADLLDVPDPNTAATIDAAIKLCALSGVGDVVRWPNPGRADEVRLYIPETRYYARIRATDDVVYVERVLLSP